MRIACLQFNPQVGDVDNNMTRADRVLTKGNPDDPGLDLLVLPEMAFTGYNFKSLNDIYRSLETTCSGISSLWARTKALDHICHVVVGYPEKVDVSKKWPTDPQYYNAAMMVAPSGDIVAHHRKAFLYYTDERWALEGDNGFYAGHIEGLGQTALGICMDINPYKFEAPWHKFEFANHIIQCHANLVIFSMAWVTPDPADEFTSAPNEPDLTTLAYWAMRLEPLVRAKSSEEIIVVFGNRCGSEGDAVYTGTSAVLGIRNGEVNVYGVLGRCENKLLVVDTNKPPKMRLVMEGNEFKLVDASTHPGGSQPQTTPTRSSAELNKAEKRECEVSRTRSRERASTPSPWKAAEPTKEAAPTPVLYDPSRQSLHRLASTPSAQRGSPTLTPSLTPDTSKKGKIQPHKLTIPETSSHSWRKSSETMTGSPVGAGRTPIRKKLKDIWEPQVTRPAPTAPDSAVVLSAVERPRGSMFSPTDSAIGRATPDTRPRKSSRRSGEHRSSKLKEVPKLDIIMAEEMAEEEASLRAQTLKDSPIATRPDSSVLTNWLETLPPVKDLETISSTPPVKDLGVISSTPPVKDLWAISNTSPTGPGAPPVGGEAAPRDCPVCHACGQEILKSEKSAVKRKSEKRLLSKAAAEVQGLKEERVEHESKDNSVSLRPVVLQNGHAHLGAQHLDRGEHGEIRGGALLQAEEKDGGVLQLQVFGTDEATPGRIREREEQGWGADVRSVSKALDGVAGVGDENKDSHATADNTVHASRASPAEVKSTNNIPVGNSEPHVNGDGAADSRMKNAKQEIQGALAPRARVVPPPIKGMEKVVTVGIRPSSVAW